MSCENLDFYACLRVLCAGLADEYERSVCYRMCRDDGFRKMLSKIVER